MACISWIWIESIYFDNGFETAETMDEQSQTIRRKQAERLLESIGSNGGGGKTLKMSERRLSKWRREDSQNGGETTLKVVEKRLSKWRREHSQNGGEN